jgi:hypothetical protein
VSGLYGPVGNVPALPAGRIIFTNAAGTLASSANYAIDPTTGAVTMVDASGTSAQAFHNYAGRKLDFGDGTTATPLSGSATGPTVKFSRIEAFTGLPFTNTHLDNESNATLAVYSIAKDPGIMQNTALQVYAISDSTVANSDAFGAIIQGYKRGTGSGVQGAGGGAYIEGRRDYDTANALGAEIRSNNYTQTSGAVNTAGSSRTMAIWATSGGNGPNAHSGFGIGFGSGDGSNARFLATVMLTDTATEPYTGAGIYDHGHGKYGVRMEGHHEVGIDTSGAAFGGRLSFTVTGGGTGYDPANPPTVTVAAPTSGVTATITAAVVASGVGIAARFGNNQTLIWQNSTAADVVGVSLNQANTWQFAGGKLVVNSTGYTQIFGGGFQLDNNQAVRFVDVGGSARSVLSLDGSNSLLFGTLQTPNTGNGAVVMQAKGVEGFRIDNNGSVRMAYFGGTPAVKQTVTGAKGSNAALASLMTALAAYGLVTDSTTA